MSKSDFIRAVPELVQLSGFAPQTIYNMHYYQRGALWPILTKFGGRLGVWREDWERFKALQMRLPNEGEQRPAA